MTVINIYQKKIVHIVIQTSLKCTPPHITAVSKPYKCHWCTRGETGREANKAPPHCILFNQILPKVN